MKVRIEKVSIYPNEDITLVAPEHLMYEFANWIAWALFEAEENAYRDKRESTAKTYRTIRNTFYEIIDKIKNQED